MIGLRCVGERNYIYVGYFCGAESAGSGDVSRKAGNDEVKRDARDG